MIQKISQVNSGVSFKKTSKNTDGGNEKGLKTPSRIQQYADSFVKHSAESAPMLLAFTGIWSLVDHVSRSVPLKKAAMHNLTNFFLPVMVISSAVLAALENKKSNKN